MALSQVEFDQMVDEHAAAMYRIAYRMVGDRHEAEDVVQDTYRSAWKSRARYEAGRGQRAWLASILRRRVIDRWRKHAQPGVLASDTPLDVEVAATDPNADGYTDEMQHALERLPLELRETLLLVVVAELTHQEAADLLGVPLGTVLSRVSRARRRMREFLVTMSQ